VKPKYPESKHRRIILLYALAVLLPGLLLGVMAWHGIQNDQARREKEGRDRLQGIRDGFCQSMDSIILTGIEKLAQDIPLKNQPAFPDYVVLAFHQSGPGDPNLFKYNLLYIPDSTNPWIQGQPNRSAGFIEAMRLEQTGRDLEKALTLFDQSTQNAKNADETLDAHLAMARINKKLNKPADAIYEWRKIEQRFSGSRINGKMPVKLIAVVEKAGLFSSLGRQDSVVMEIRSGYSVLTQPGLTYEASQYRFFKSQLEQWNTLRDPEIDSLRKNLQIKQEETEFYIRLIQERNPLVLEGGIKPQGMIEGLHRFPFSRTNGSLLFLNVESVEGDRFGMVMDIGALIKSKSEEVMKQADPMNALSWIIRDKQDSTVVSRINSDKNEYIHFGLTTDFPGWTLSIKENEMNWMDRLLSKGTGTFLLIFLFIALIMVLGLIFTLYTLNQELKLNRLKSDFIANVSHELKSPLTSIRHLMDLLHTNRVKTADQRKKYYATMIEQTEHLSYLIENILDFSRLEGNRKKYQFKEVDFSALMDQWIDQLDDHARGRNIEIKRIWDKNLPTIYIDSDAIQQVIFNLVDNAIKFSADSKIIEISCGLQEDWIRTCVRDWGYGIAKKDQDKIFDRFYRCEENLFRGIKGSGIGLTLVRKIVADHGGRIAVESSPGAGSLFCFYLPVKTERNHEENTGR
jgi:signal transduction histidine kinase